MRSKSSPGYFMFMMVIGVGSGCLIASTVIGICHFMGMDSETSRTMAVCGVISSAAGMLSITINEAAADIRRKADE